MASVLDSADPTLRLADQLQVLSQVAESLTYRLLELEERLVDQELLVAQRLEEGSGQDSTHGEAMDERLGDTEGRLARIEAALQSLEGPGALRHLRAVQPPALQQEPHPLPIPAEGAAGGIAEADPFLEEGEQPFMDELIA